MEQMKYSIRSQILACYYYGFKMNSDKFYNISLKSSQNPLNFAIKKDIKIIKEQVKSLFKDNKNTLISIEPNPFLIPTMKNYLPVELSDKSNIFVVIY